jgi:hypothetical protein
MESYKIIRKGKNVHHCLNIPKELLKEDLEITIRPLIKRKSKSQYLEKIYNAYKGENPFKSVDGPIKWQDEIRDEWA